jgi:hypothetical protein
MPQILRAIFEAGCQPKIASAHIAVELTCRGERLTTPRSELETDKHLNKNHRHSISLTAAN